jgi:Ca2+-binding EF-hand superfamily protein
MGATGRIGLATALIAVSGLSVTFAALAGHARNSKAHTAWRAMDTDGNGELSAAEHAAAAEARFRMLDPDKDGQVTEAELDAARYKMTGNADKPPKGEQPIRTSAADMIAKVDADGDGIMSAAEHADGAKAMFEAMDADDDGSLTKAELREGRKQIRNKQQYPAK